jgi:peptidoglycan hydrolase CwlO-like protein
MVRFFGRGSTMYLHKALLGYQHHLMKLKSLLILTIFFLGCFLVLQPSFPVWAEDSEEKMEDKKDDLEDEIEEYKEKIDDLKGKAKTLANEIDYIDSQVSLTELRIRDSVAKIAAKEDKIEDLAGDIESLNARIEKLQHSIDYQKDILAARLRERYKSRESAPVLFLLESENLGQAVNKAEYLKVMGVQDNLLIGDMSKTKQNFALQKKLYEDTKKKEEQLRAELESERANLNGHKWTLESQKSEKDNLLELTQNDEEKYQNLLNEAKKELDQITRAVSVLKHQDGEQVKRGDFIGVQGNTGYSFGDHLHFGVYKYGSFDDIDGWDWYYSNYVDPAKKLKSKTIYWNTGCESASDKNKGKGDWRWPLDSPTVSQGFGNTCYSNSYYGGNPHPAYDMYGSHGAKVYAVDDGEAYFCRNCLGDGGNGVFIFHDDDYMTLYWHLQ